MSNKSRITEEEIDDAVTAEADTDVAWEPPVHVKRASLNALPLPPDLIARAAFFARLHRAADVGEWLRRIIEERVDMEEAAFGELKRDPMAK